MARSSTLSLFLGVLLLLNVFAAESLARQLYGAAVDGPGKHIYPRPPAPKAPHEAKKCQPASLDEAKKVLPAAHEVVSAAGEAEKKIPRGNEVKEEGFGDSDWEGGDARG